MVRYPVRLIRMILVQVDRQTGAGWFRSTRMGVDQGHWKLAEQDPGQHRVPHMGLQATIQSSATPHAV